MPFGRDATVTRQSISVVSFDTIDKSVDTEVVCVPLKELVFPSRFTQVISKEKNRSRPTGAPGIEKRLMLFQLPVL